MRGKIFWPAICCLALVLSSLAALAADSPPRKARAGVFNFDGYHMRDGAGRLTGYGIDLLGLISEYSHLDFIFTGYEKSWQEMQEMLKNGEIDILTSARRTPEREAIFAYSLPVGRNYTILSVKNDNTRLRGGDYPTYDGMVVGVLEGSSQNSRLADFALAKGFGYTTKQYPTPAALARALQAGEVDAILSSNLRKPENEKLLDVLNADNFYVIARKEDQALIDEINYALEQMNINEGNWENDLHYLYYGPARDPSPKFTERERAYITRAASGEKTVRAGARADAPPYSYLEGGRLRGILPDFFGRVMDAAGLAYELVPLEPGQKVDVEIDRLAPVEAREGERLPGFTTEPYMRTGLARVARQDFHGEAKSVAVAAESAAHARAALPADAVAREYPTARSALAAVKTGEADEALVFPYAAQVYLNNEDPDNTLYYTVLNDPGAAFRFFVPADADHELISILNKGIRTVPEGSLDQLSSKYTSMRAGEMSVAHYLRAHPGVAFGSLFAALLALSLLAFFYMRALWGRRLLAATEKANKSLEEQLSIVEALSRDYTTVFAINPRTGVAGVVKYCQNPEISGEYPEGRPWDDVLAEYARVRAHPDDRERLEKNLSLAGAMRRLARGEEFAGTYQVTDRDGAIHHIQYTFVRVRASGAEFILAGFRNIDELFRREQQQKQRLATALEQARQASAAKTAFLNSISHDIRTPMNAIIGFANLALSHIGNTPQVKDFLGKIMTSGNHLLSLINDVLDMSRIESGKMRLEEKENSLPEILRGLRTIVQTDARAKGLELVFEEAGLVNGDVFCDRLRLNQVLLNILGNAIKYTPAGGRVELRASQKGPARGGRAAFEFRVRDTGIGMAPEFLKNVFEPFEREATSTVSGIEGTGLGLAITKKIVDMMGGEIAVASEPGKGSEFVLDLEFRLAPAKAGGLEEASAEAAPDAALFRGKRILLAEDNEMNQEIARMILEDAGFVVDIVDNGSQAVEAVRNSPVYDVVLMDVQMPVMDGHEAARRIRALGDAARAGIPIIAMTANAFNEDREAALAAGMDGHVAKPIDIPTLLATLKKILAGRCARRGGYSSCKL